MNKKGASSQRVHLIGDVFISHSFEQSCDEFVFDLVGCGFDVWFCFTVHMSYYIIRLVFLCLYMFLVTRVRL
jgi:hypothetical protein